MTWIETDSFGNYGFRDPASNTTIRFSHRESLLHDKPIVRFVFDDKSVYLTDLSTAVTAYPLVGGAGQKIERGPQTQFLGQHNDYLLVHGANPTDDGDAIHMLDKSTLTMSYWFETAQYPFVMHSDRNLLAVAALGTGCVLLSLWSEERHRNRLFDLTSNDFLLFAGDSWTGGSFLLSREFDRIILSAWTDSFELLWSKQVALYDAPQMGIFVSDATVWIASRNDLLCFSKLDGRAAGRAEFATRLTGLYRRFPSDLVPSNFDGTNLVTLSSFEHTVTETGPFEDSL